MEFYKKYCDLRVRVAPFRMKSEYEYIKTVAAIDSLANRAKDMHEGCDVGCRFRWIDFWSEETFMNKAFRYVEALECGEFPLKGMFAEPGRTVVDHSFIEKDGVMHVFYSPCYIGYTWDQRLADMFGHASSTDLINWEIHPVAFTTAKGEFDDYQVWAPAVIEADGKYWMFYTGVNFNVTQAICLAVSDDLYNWTRVEGNPMFKPGPWCPWDINKWSDCRDSMILKDDDGTYYMYYCSSMSIGEGRTKPVIGVAVSTDLMHWEDKAPLEIPDIPHQAESPFALKKDGKYYLFYTNCGIGTCYATSDNPLTGWTTLPDRKNLIYGTCCSEIFKYNGKWYFSLTTYDGNVAEQYLQIAEFHWHEDGTVSMGEFLK